MNESDMIFFMSHTKSHRTTPARMHSGIAATNVPYYCQVAMMKEPRDDKPYRQGMHGVPGLGGWMRRSVGPIRRPSDTAIAYTSCTATVLYLGVGLSFDDMSSLAPVSFVSQAKGWPDLLSFSPFITGYMYTSDDNFQCLEY